MFRATEGSTEHSLLVFGVETALRTLSFFSFFYFIFLNLCVGSHGPGCLYVLGRPPRGYLPFFATLNPQSTCHGPGPGPTLAPWCSGGLPACPATESTRKDPRPEEKKSADEQKKNNLHTHSNTTFPLGMWRLEIPGVSQVAKGQHRRSHAHEPM